MPSISDKTKVAQRAVDALKKANVPRDSPLLEQAMADLAEAKKEDFDSKPPDKQAQSLTAQIAITKRKLAKKDKDTKAWGEQALHAHQQFLEGAEEVDRLQEGLEALQARLAMSVATQAAAAQPAPVAVPATHNVMDLIAQMQSLLTSLVPPVTDDTGQPTQEVVDCRAWISDLGTKATAIVEAKARHDMQQQDKQPDGQQTTSPQQPPEADAEMGEDVESSKKLKTDAAQSSTSPPPQGQSAGEGKDEEMEEGGPAGSHEKKEDKKENSIQDLHEQLSKFSGASARAKTKGKSKPSSG